MKKLLLLSMLFLLISAGFIHGATFPNPFAIYQPEEPECHINSNGCYSNGGEFGYHKDGSCYCDMSNAPSPAPINLQPNLPLENEGLISSSNIITSADSPKEKSQEERDCVKKGCFENDRCYPFGYRKDEKYCEEKAKVYAPSIYRSAFVNQSEKGEECNQNYECKTSICSDNICVNVTEQKNEIMQLYSEIEEMANKTNECHGCFLDNECYPVNNIKNDKYCSVNKEWEEQKETKEFCDNSFECKSNICINNECVNGGLLQKILNWFRKLFG